MKTRKGFTLIELMIVVSIIGILLAIVIGKVSEVQGKKACRDNPWSKACTEYQHRLAAQTETSSTTPPVCPNVQIVNDTTILFNGHVYKRLD